MATTITFGTVTLLSPSGSLLEMLSRWGEVARDYYTFKLPMGTANWGTFTAVVQGKDVGVLIGSTTDALTITTNDDAVDALAFANMCISEISMIDADGNFYRVDFADPRFLLRLKTCSMRVNMTTPALAASTYQDTAKKLPEIVGLLTTALGITAALPSGYESEEPDNLILKHAPAAIALDALLSTYGLVLLYQPYDGTYSIEQIGANRSTVTAYAFDGTNPRFNATRVDNNSLVYNSSPETAKIIYEKIDAEDTADPEDSVSSTTGRPTSYASGREVGLPAASYTYNEGADKPSSADLVGGGFFGQIIPSMRQPFFGLQQPPVVGAVSQILWRIGVEEMFTVVVYTARPQAVCFNTFNQSAHLGVGSRIDPFGRAQYRFSGKRAVGFQIQWTTTTNRLYKGQLATGPGTYVDGTPTCMILNGAEKTTDASHPLLDASNPFEKEGSGVIVGTDEDTGLPIILTWMDWNPNMFAVLVKKSGGGGGDSTHVATWDYNLYRLSDRGYTTPLNLSGAIQPQCSRARILGATATPADDGAVGSAYYDCDHHIQLFECPERITQTNCP